MFGTLIGSRPPVVRPVRGSLISAGIHLVIIAGVIAIGGTKTVAVYDKPTQVSIVYTAPRPAPDAPASRTPARTGAPDDRTTLRVPTAPLVTTPVNIDVNTTIPTTTLDPGFRGTAGEFTPSGGTSIGGDVTGGAPTGDAPFTEHQVERIATAIPGTGVPSYPTLLRQAGVEGEAIVQFVVDSTGRMEPGSLTLVRATHAEFFAAVRAASPRMRFRPAEVRGRPVRMLVVQPFAFALSR